LSIAASVPYRGHSEPKVARSEHDFSGPIVATGDDRRDISGTKGTVSPGAVPVTEGGSV